MCGCSGRGWPRCGGEAHSVKLVGSVTMDRLLAYISGSFDDELLLRNEYLVAESG